MEYYCDFAIGDPIHGAYHDREYGFPVEDESELFERLLLEINQAGLNWELILKKREGFRDSLRWLQRQPGRWLTLSETGQSQACCSDARIIRNKLKVNAAIVNAQVILEMRVSHGGFANWLRAITTRCQRKKWVKLI